MPRELSSTTLQAINASRTGVVFLVLLEINHDDFGAPIRLVENPVDIVSNGDTYTAANFDFIMPDMRTGQTPRASISFANVDQTLIQALRGLTSPPTIDMTMVSDNDLDFAEIGPFTLTLLNVTYDALSIQGDLVMGDVLEESYPGTNATPILFPGMF